MRGHIERPRSGSPDDYAAGLADHDIADQFFSRAAGSPLVTGNDVTVLRNASENYPAWTDAIRSAGAWIHFESYIIHDDEVGRFFADALIAKASDGVAVRVLYDWAGGFATSRAFWRRLRKHGVEVRSFNSPRLESPFGWLSRDHRKSLIVDGRVAFVTGLCVGKPWVGDPGRGTAPWRDTGVAIRGPAVAAVAQAFAAVWHHAGAELPPSERVHFEDIRPAGDVAMRIVAGEPGRLQLYGIDQMLAARARDRLWLTDAYFIGTTSYVHSLSAAARDGVDVRLLVPGSSDLPVLRAVSRAAYRPLLEAGIRIYEWTGTMLHAKTAVIDGRWTRVGSTNLNPASWLGNWELNAVIEDAGITDEMAGMYMDDLHHSVEIVLDRRGNVRKPPGGEGATAPGRQRRRGHARRAAAGAIGIGSAVGAAVAERRELGPAESGVLLAAGGVLVAVVLVCVFVPLAISVPIAVIAAWVAGAAFVRAYRIRRGRRQT